MKETSIIINQPKWIAYFQKNLEQLHILLSEKQLGQFYRYYELLTEWNSFMNLTAIIEPQEMIKKHFIDSLSLIYIIPDLADKDYALIDVGTGAGFPGIPLKIAFPGLQVTLLDSLKKRVQFLEEVITQLELQNIQVIHGRAEDHAGTSLRESFDICVSRAVANLAVLSEYCIPFVKVGGAFISYKSEKLAEEYEEAKDAIQLLGGVYERQKNFILPDSDISRSLLVIEKATKTPEKYPRKAGVPSREPLKKK